MDLKSFSDWIQGDLAQRILIIIAAIILIYAVVYFSKKAISKKLTDSNDKYRARKATGIFGYVIFIATLLFVFSDKLGNVGIAVGLLGAGIAFALQEVITSFAGWLNILITGQIKTGQRVKIGNIAGDVIDIGVMKTTIMEIGDWVNGDLYNGRITSLSNSFIFKSPVQNYSGDYPFLWDEIEVPIRTESDYKLAREVFTNVINEVCGEYAKRSKETWNKMTDKYNVENAQVEPMITLRFDQNWITFTLRYVVNYKLRRSTRNKLFTRLLEEIDKYDNIIMIAKTAMEVTNVPPKDSKSDTKKV